MNIDDVNDIPVVNALIFCFGYFSNIEVNRIVNTARAQGFTASTAAKPAKPVIVKFALFFPFLTFLKLPPQGFLPVNTFTALYAILVGMFNF